MSNKATGWAIIGTLGLAILGGIAGAGDGYYAVVGILLFVFGIWGAIKLINIEEEEV